MIKGIDMKFTPPQPNVVIELFLS
ncbi:hypothetical protein MNBD_GAMMA18-694, partial [hydrothermal vent metagenome]